MDDFLPGPRHVTAAPLKAFRAELITTLRLPANPAYDPHDKFSVVGEINQLVTSNIQADELSNDKATALAVACLAKFPRSAAHGMAHQRPGDIHPAAPESGSAERHG
ncbi:hypothetical protein [Streptomyces sp. NPDC001759]